MLSSIVAHKFVSINGILKTSLKYFSSVNLYLNENLQLKMYFLSIDQNKCFSPGLEKCYSLVYWLFSVLK